MLGWRTARRGHPRHRRAATPERSADGSRTEVARCLREIPEPDRGIDRSPSEGRSLERMSVSFVAPIDRRRQLAAGDHAACLGLPIGVLAVLDILPFDIHVRHGDQSVPLRPAGRAPGDLLAHAGPDIDLVVPIEQARPYRRQIWPVSPMQPAGRIAPSGSGPPDRHGPRTAPGRWSATSRSTRAASPRPPPACDRRGAVGHDRELAERILDRPPPRTPRVRPMGPDRPAPGPGDRCGDHRRAGRRGGRRPAGGCRRRRGGGDVGLAGGPERRAATAATRSSPPTSSRRAAARRPSLRPSPPITSGSMAPATRSDLPVTGSEPAGRAVALADGFVTMTRGTTPNHGIPAVDAFRLYGS